MTAVSGDEHRAPRVSVIVAASTAAPTSLERCLGSLIAQDLPHADVEVLVAARSDEDISAVVEQAKTFHHAHRLILLESPGRSVGEDRNIGLERARGDHIVFVDATDTVSPTYLSELLDAADGISLPVAGIEDLGTEATHDADDGHDATGAAVGVVTEITDAAARPADTRGKLYPRPWIGQIRFNGSEGVGRDAVFNAHVFRPYSRRFARATHTPRRRGARYYRQVPDPSAQGPTDPTTVMAHRLEVLRSLAELDRDPRDRAPLTAALMREQGLDLARLLEDHPALRPQIEAAYEESGVRGIDAHTTEDVHWPGYSTVLGRPSPSQPTRIALVSGTADAIAGRRNDIAFLRAHGIEIAGGFLTGTTGKNFPDGEWSRFAIRHERPAAQRRTGTARSWVNRADRLSRKAMRRTALQLVPLTTLARYVDPARRAEADLFGQSPVVALDPAGEVLARGLGQVPHVGSWLDGRILAVAAVAARIAGNDAKTVSRAAQALADTSPSVGCPPPQVWTLAALRLIRNARRAEARELLHAARRAFPTSADLHGWKVLHLLADVLERGELPADYGPICQAVMREADYLMRVGATDHSLFLIEHTVEVLLHPEAQANVADPPLVREPAALLAPLTGSWVWNRLTRPRDDLQRPAPARARGGRRPSVLVLPGAYPKFTGPVRAALQGLADIEVLQLSDFAPHYASTNPSLSLLAVRRAVAFGEQPELNPDILEAFSGRDIIFADWADKGAMLASLLAPKDARLVIRFHGVDTLSVWQFLIDWSRVSDVVFVSEHLRSTVLAHLGDRLAGVRQHVMGNAVDTARFSGDSGDVAHRTLGLVGWGQRVKDPMWALEVLAELRGDDPTWRLKLIGADFPGRPARLSEQRYAAAFRERALQPDLRSAITYVGHSRHLPRHLADIGFALSSSLRESWHIGAMEMVAAHAVPVIRDWPVYRDHGGAAAMFPSDWVVQTPADAAERIRRHSDMATWRKAADEARQHVHENFGIEAVAVDYRRIVLGGEPGVP